jgi:hypothetical protein
MTDWGNLKGETLDPSKCKARVSDHDSRWPHYYQCGATIKRDGYCNRHHPDKIKAKNEASDAKYKAENHWANWLDEEKALRLKIADAVIDGADNDNIQRLVDDYKTLKAAKPPVVALARWRRR